MIKQKIVVALGGNAILSDDASAQAQQEALKTTAHSLVELVKAGHDVVITHGNGPQVGNLLLQQLASDSKENPALPLDTLVAMTEGSIGFWLETALRNELQAQGIDKEVAVLLTQALVSKEDPAFSSPSKPIGPFLSEEEAKKQQEETGATFKEDAGRGWRKVVPSPKPIGIKEASTIRQLVESGTIVVAGGGGGIPVIEENGQLIGKEAVIDKDFASEQLAELIEANQFIILTGVDNVYVNYNQPDQKKLEQVTVQEMKAYMDDNQFAPGSMLPKVQAAIAFVENHPDGEAVITSLANIEQALKENGGTRISK